MAVGQAVQLAEHRIAVPLVERARLEVVGVEPSHPAAAATRFGLGGTQEAGAEAAAAVAGRQPELVDEQEAARGLRDQAADRLVLDMGHEAEPAVIQRAEIGLVVRQQPAQQELGVGLAGRVGQLDRGLECHHAAGWPSVMPWMPPPPWTRSRASIGTISRPGQAAANALAATLSVAPPKLGMITAPFAR